MDPAAFAQLAEQSGRFAQRYAPLFDGWASQDRGEQYPRGLLVGRMEAAKVFADRSQFASPRSATEMALATCRWVLGNSWPLDLAHSGGHHVVCLQPGINRETSVQDAQSVAELRFFP